MTHCPCGSGIDYSDCCGRFIDDGQIPTTPEALMRSRYTAYSRVNIDYIAKTMIGPAARNFDKVAVKKWAENATWLGLTIISAPTPKPDDDVAYVEFIAKFSYQNRPQSIFEKSKFIKEKGVWIYYDGQEPKTGRNDPCPCKSGKKYKKCCG